MDTEFYNLFDKSELPKVIKVNRTLSREECCSVYNYFKAHNPKIMFEFGVQNGCSTKIFVEISKWLNSKFTLHSWDIVDEIKCISKKDFVFHLDDVTGREEQEFDQYNPHLVFLDAHPYKLTRNIMKICLSRKIDFMCHDVAFDIFERTCQRTNNFQDLSIKTNGNWELYLLGELVSKDLLTKDYYENDELKVTCNRNSCGLSITEFKR